MAVGHEPLLTVFCISQIGLDPESPDLALLTCYYRWGEKPTTSSSLPA
jgi:hypothetical protein